MASVEENGVARILRNHLCRIVRVTLARASLGHGALVGDVTTRGHIGGHEVDSAIAIDVAEIRTHRRIGYVWQHARDHVGERAVVVIMIQRIGHREVVGYVKIGPAVAVEIPPGR